MNLSKRNFKLAKKTVFVFKNQLNRSGLLISSDQNTSFSITTPNTSITPRND
ncbi:hypothetical protein SAMN05443550_101552 [Pedobacter hartonius]|uniref:Uncharacterized protein n=1 Tax=Pedobacter hartonius TaxID=425514 RepID=A0A1H3XAE6_9SPHI|nr:hypothetical protein SAMN05443550_101552 [Pedobacter hartonius]